MPASGRFVDNRTQPEAQTKKSIAIYTRFRRFARPEVWIPYFSKKFGVSIVARYFMCVRAVGAARYTVVIDAVRWRNSRLTEKPSGAIGKQKKVVRPTVKPSVEDG